MGKKLAALVRWIVLAVGFAVGGVLAGWLVLWVGLHSSTVRVPPVLGLEASRAVAVLHEHGLVGRVQDGTSDPETPPGRIARQQPAAGFQLKRGATVRLSPSLGRAAKKVPNLTALPVSLAEAELDGEGLALGRRCEVEGQADAVVVLAHTPDAGTLVPPATSLAVLINRSPRIRRYVMPDFVGTLEVDATRIIRGLGFRLAEIQQVAYAGVPAGLILRQDPAAGGPVVEASVVVLWVSR